MENFKVTVDETLQMVANSGTVYPDDMQIFEGDDRKVEFITLLKNLYNSPDNSVYINLQCASYTEGFNLAAKSKDFNLIKGEAGSGSAGAIKSPHGGLSTLEIVLICVFSILGLLLLLGLLILLYCCCCGAWSKRKEAKSETKNKNTMNKNQPDQGVEVPIRTLTSADEDEFVFTSNNNQKASNNNTDSTNRLTYRTSLHLDNINQDQLQREQPFSYINEPKHVTTLPNLKKNELTVIKDPSNYEESPRGYEYDTQYYRDNYKNFLYKKENFYEVKTTTTTKNLPSVSGTVPLEINYPNRLVHDV